MKNKKIIVGINASFLRKPETGIGQVTFNFLRKLGERQAGNGKRKGSCKFILYLEEDLPKKLKLSKNFEKRIFLPVWRRDDLVRKIWWEKHLLPKRAKRDGCDVFLSLYQNPSVFKDIPHLMVVHDVIPKIFPDYLDNSRKKAYQKLTEKGILAADKIMAVSTRTEKDLVSLLGIPAEKISVNHIGIGENFKKKMSRKKVSGVLKKFRLDPGYILAGGGMEKRKNVEGVIRAYKIILEKNKNLHFAPKIPKLMVYGKLLPGLSLATDVEKLANELNLKKQIRFLGNVRQEDLPAVFSGALMFVYPSFYEGFGLPPLEAMSLAVPTIVSKKSSLPEVCRDAALYCDPSDPRDIAMVMKKILLEKDLRKTLSERGKERAKKFSWKKFTEKMMNVIHEL